MTTYEATPKMKDAKFRGQRALVCQALSQLKGPKSLEEIAAKVEKNGGYEMNKWAKEHGGLAASVRYHLRGMVELGVVKVHEEKDAKEEPAKPASKADKKGQAA